MIHAAPRRQRREGYIRGNGKKNSAHAVVNDVDDEPASAELIRGTPRS